MTSRAWARAWLVALVCGCGAEPVEARAIWLDDFGGDGHRRIHVYDRGRLEEFEVLGEGGPVERVELDPHGRGVLVRSGEQGGAWFDLEDGRRLPLLLPSSAVGSGQGSVTFAFGALTWLEDLDGTLTVVPLASGLELARREDGTVAPLTRSGSLKWMVPAAHAPIVFAAGLQDDHASFLRYPVRAGQPLAIALEAEAEGLSRLPSSLISSRHRCSTPLECYALVSVEAGGELAIFSNNIVGAWELFDRRSPDTAGPLELPPRLAQVAAQHDLRLLQVLDRAVSIWLGPARLHRFDRARERVDSLPIFLDPPIHWTAADRGRAVILSSGSGPVYRADLDGLRAISVEVTPCANASDPVVSPNGRWLAWTCSEFVTGSTAAQSSVVVRVSELGLERYVGIPMAMLAIDDEGDLLLYSVDTSSEGVDAIGSTSVPQNLFVLSGDGVLTRIDELEPAPAPVLVGIDLASYMQGVALAGEHE